MRHTKEDVKSHWTKEEWEAEGISRFGEDRRDWAFVCPMCFNEMSIARAKRDFPQLKGRGWAPESECVGRYIDVPDARNDRGRCDWCAYGLFNGPWHVSIDGAKPVSVFAFARVPR